MAKVLRIAWYTVQDQLQRKSFYLLLAVALLLVLSLRGCYNASYMINHQPVDGITVARYASLFAFHLIAGGMLLMAVLISMSILPNDWNDGTMVLYLCRPVSRPQYVLGRLGGLWLLVSLFMLMLHTTVMLIAWHKTGVVLPGYLAASLICSLNIFFAIGLTLLCSLILPGFMTALTALGLIGLGFISDNAIRLMHSSIAHNVLQNSAAPEPAWWRLIYPKLSMVQHYAATMISNDRFQAIGPVHPLVNVALYCAMVVAILLLIFARKEI
ncbi:MAG: ABC transporter permease subunit [Desulfobacterales bacterium]|nr:ABC transporter permease subunit [Desulfobacterales bacterium]